MSDDTASASTASIRSFGRAQGGSYLQQRAAAFLPLLVGIWIFSGGFVFIEPSPYELMFLVVLPTALIAGLGLYKGTINLLNLMVIFVPFALIGAFQPKHLELLGSLIYVIVTIFLWFTAYFVANFVAESPTKHVRVIMKSYTAIAVIAALIGTFAYLGIMPGKEMFLRYGRARATFNDSNVYGPFLILPAIFALQRLFLLTGKRQIISGFVYLILFVGVFVSFSRGAWGHLAFSSMLLYGLIYVLEAKARDKVRMLLIAIIGLVGLTVVMMALLSIDSVRDLFLQRFSVTQDYDTGSTGRFGRVAYALELALSHPWGLGPFEFSTLRISEEPHNTYVKVLLTYGWMGGLMYFALVGSTIWRCLKRLTVPSPSRLLLLPLFCTYISLVIESAIIDTDHWRHFFLITGMIWGVTTLYRTPNNAPESRQEALV